MAAIRNCGTTMIYHDAMNWIECNWIYRNAACKELKLENGFNQLQTYRWGAGVRCTYLATFISSPSPLLLLLLWWQWLRRMGQKCPDRSRPKCGVSHSSRGPLLWISSSISSAMNIVWTRYLRGGDCGRYHSLVPLNSVLQNTHVGILGHMHKFTALWMHAGMHFIIIH